MKLDDGLVGTTRNITARRQAEEDHQKQALFLSQLLQTSPYGIITYEAVRASQSAEKAGTILDFRSTFFNRAYEQIFAESTEAIRDKTFRERFAYETHADLFSFYVQLVEADQPFQRERYYPHLGKWLDLSGIKFLDGFLVVLQDITAQKQQGEALRIANEELARSNEYLKQFAYVASYDLQEPLRKIISFGNLLAGQYATELGEQGIDLIGRMQSATLRMQLFIKDLLSYSQLTTEREGFQSVDLNDLVQAVLSDLETAITDSKAVIQLDKLPTLKGNALQLRQLFQNLISNALKFRRTDIIPHIRITNRIIQGQPVRKILPDVSTTQSFHLLEVIDNGIGFEPGQSERIFGAFQRLHGRSSAYSGTGIGLAIVQKVVEQHQGYIRAEGRPGQGSIFQLLLPVVDTK